MIRRLKAERRVSLAALGIDGREWAGRVHTLAVSINLGEAALNHAALLIFEAFGATHGGGGR